MRRVTYKSVLASAYRKLTGQAVEEVSDEESEVFNGFINDRCREFWRKAWWYELTTIEHRYFIRDYAATQNYYRGDQVRATDGNTYHLLIGQTKGNSPPDPTRWGLSAEDYITDADGVATPDFSCDDAYVPGDRRRMPNNGRFYQCIAPNTRGDGTKATPLDIDGALYWAELIALNFWLPFTGVGRTAIGDIEGIYATDPRIDRTAERYDYTLQQEFASVWAQPDDCFVRFRLRVPDFTGPNFVQDEVVGYGTTRYDTASGDYWRYEPPPICGGAGGDITTESGVWSITSSGTTMGVMSGGYETVQNGYWRRLEFPWVLSTAVAQAAFADYLKADGQDDRAIRELAEALRLLTTELSIIQLHQGQTHRLPVRTGRTRITV